MANSSFPFPRTVDDWLSWVFMRIMAAGSLLPGEPSLNFLAPLVATDNPENNSTDISFSGTLANFFLVPAAAAGTTQLPSGEDCIVIEGDANAGSQTFNAPETSQDGYVIEYYDTSGATSPSKTVSFTDTFNGFKFQDPDSPASFLTTYEITAPRNLRWRRVTCARTATTFWGAN